MTGEAVCRGCWALGTACGQCTQCVWSALEGARLLQEELRKAQADLLERTGRLAWCERRVQKLELVIRGLLLSADAMWEEKSLGHDWREACQAARRALSME